MDRIAQEVTPLSTIDYTYDEVGRRSTMTVAEEPAVNYTYDDAGRLTGISRDIGGTPRTYNLFYDNGGRRTALQTPLATAGQYVTTAYGYDIANRVTSMLLQGPSAQIENLVYAFDPNGNRASFTRSAAQTVSPAVGGTTHDAANEMLAQDGKSLSYDANGNLSSRTDSCGTTTYTWDARDRLTGISGYKPDCTGLTASFAYDAFNRRISKTINGTTTQYVYDGWDVVQEITDGTKTNYVRTLNIDEPLTRITGSTIRHFVTDALGSVMALADDTGATKTTYVYDAFGNATATGETSDNAFQFTGREDDGTGLYYYRYRYYSPEMQRFISEDPIGLDGGDLNFFGYVWNSPNNLIDPLGEAGQKGERGWAGKPSGTANPFKHLQPHPTDPTKVIYKDPRTGKQVTKPKPPGYDDQKKPKQCKFENNDNGDGGPRFSFKPPTPNQIAPFLLIPIIVILIPVGL